MKSKARRVQVHRDRFNRWFFWDHPQGEYVLAPVEEWERATVVEATGRTLDELERRSKELLQLLQAFQEVQDDGIS